jgi:TetR/AcrR family transcriptional regulator, ethionamide resistance regulator
MRQNPAAGSVQPVVSTSAPTAKTPRRAATEAGVLAAAEALFQEGVCYADLGVERIAKRAGISRTAFYFYFKDKRDLLVRLTEGIGEDLYESAKGWWDGEPGPEGVRPALDRVVATYLEHAPLLRAVVEACPQDEVIATFWRGLIGRFVEASRVRIDDERAAGRARPGPPAEGVAFALCWMTERAVYQHVVQGDGAGPEALVASLESVWRGAIYGD